MDKGNEKWFEIWVFMVVLMIPYLLNSIAESHLACLVGFQLILAGKESDLDDRMRISIDYLTNRQNDEESVDVW